MTWVIGLRPLLFVFGIGTLIVPSVSAQYFLNGDMIGEVEKPKDRKEIPLTPEQMIESAESTRTVAAHPPS